MKVINVLKDDNLEKEYEYVYKDVVRKAKVVMSLKSFSLILIDVDTKTPLFDTMPLSDILELEFKECIINKFSTFDTRVSYHINESDDVIRSTPTFVENYNEFTTLNYARKIAYKQWFERFLLAYKDEYNDVCDVNKEDSVRYYVKMNYVIGKMVIDWTSKISIQGVVQFNSKKLLEKHLKKYEAEWKHYFKICKEIM